MYFTVQRVVWRNMRKCGCQSIHVRDLRRFIVSYCLLNVINVSKFANESKQLLHVYMRRLHYISFYVAIETLQLNKTSAFYFGTFFVSVPCAMKVLSLLLVFVNNYRIKFKYIRLYSGEPSGG